MRNNELENRLYWYIKRLLDIVLAIILIILTLPFMLITGIVLVINLGFPIFNQEWLCALEQSLICDDATKLGCDVKVLKKEM